MELYFWILLGAILLVSLTILLARPPPSNNNKYNYDNLDGYIEEATGGKPAKTTSNKSNIEENTEEPEEELSAEVSEKIERRKWALGFVMFGSTFIMMGAILLFFSKLEFTSFLGSCMMYIGIIALCKGASFELQKDKKYTDFSSVIFFLLIFFINFILLTELLDVLGTYAWAVTTANRKAGDLILIYLLPYFIWKIVPTFGVVDTVKNKSSSELDFTWLFVDLRSASFFAIFNYILLIATSQEYIFWPILNQYAEPGFQMSLYLILFSMLGHFARLIYGGKTVNTRDEETSESKEETNESS